MKKVLLSLLALTVLAAATLLIYQGRPMKRHARHLVKARILVEAGNLEAARMEYEKAYDITGEYTPFASLEVLRLTNRILLQQKQPSEALANSQRFVEAHPSNAQGWVGLAEIAFLMREHGTGFAAIESALAADPAGFPARLLLARIRTQQGRLDLAEEQLRVLSHRFPDSLPALLPLAENLLRQGQVRESRAFLRKAIGRDRQNHLARMLLVDSYLMERNTDSAQAALESWRGADPSLALPIAVRKARIYSMQDSIAQALEALQPYLSERRESNLPAFTEWAVLEAKLGHYDSAVHIYSMMEGMKPAAGSEAQILKAFLHLKNQNPARALESLKQLQGGRGGGLILPSALGAAYLAIGQDHKLAQLLQQQPDSLRGALESLFGQFPPGDKRFIGQWALVHYFQAHQQPYFTFQAIRDLHAQWPRSELAISLFAGHLATQRRYAEAAAVLEKLSRPTLQQSLFLMTLQARAQRADRAKAIAESLLRRHPAQPGLNMFLADYHLSAKHNAKAMAHYEQELQLDSGNVVALNNLAWEYGIVRRDLAKAKPYLDRLRARKALDPRILDTIGWILARNGDQDGEQYLRLALNLVPDFPAFNYHLAWMLSQGGRREDARRHLESALRSQVPFEERAEAEKLADSL